MSRVRIEPTISVFERVNTVHALDRTATVIGERDALGTCVFVCLCVHVRVQPMLKLHTRCVT
jgi:hypothetical protein